MPACCSLPPNALVQLQAHYHHCGEAASEKCLSVATFVRRRGTITRLRMPNLGAPPVSSACYALGTFEPSVALAWNAFRTMTLMLFATVVDQRSSEVGMPPSSSG